MTDSTLDVASARAEGSVEIEAGRTMLTRLKQRHGLRPRTLGADRGPFFSNLLAQDALRG